MTEAEALKTCSGYVAYDNIKGYFPFSAANALVATGKYEFFQVSFWGYVLRLLPKEERHVLAAGEKRRKYGGAMDWLDK